MIPERLVIGYQGSERFSHFNLRSVSAGGQAPQHHFLEPPPGPVDSWFADDAPGRISLCHRIARVLILEARDNQLHFHFEDVMILTHAGLREALDGALIIATLLQNLSSRPPESHRPRSDLTVPPRSHPDHERRPLPGARATRDLESIDPGEPAPRPDPWRARYDATSPLTDLWNTPRRETALWLDALYEARGLRPALKLWCDDPVSAVLIASALTNRGSRPVRERLLSREWDPGLVGLNFRGWPELRERRYPPRALGPETWRIEDLGRLLERHVRRELSSGGLLAERVCARAVLGPLVPPRALDPGTPLDRRALLELDTEALPGALDPRYRGGLAHLEGEFRDRSGLLALRNAIPFLTRWWAFDDCLVLVPVPSSFHFDSTMLPHRTDGPALEFANGRGPWCWRGVLVPREAIEHPATITHESLLAEPDARARRVMAERAGAASLARSRRVEVIDRDGPNELLRIPMPEDDPVVTVRVTCPSTHEQHHLRVPPWMTRCRDAIAWTFRLPPTAYTPQRET